MINKAILLGRIGKKECKVLQNDNHLTVLSIATNRKWKDKSGEKQEVTTWHNVSLFNKLAEIAEKYTKVGDLIYIEGEIQNKKIMGNDGVEKWIYSVVGSELKLIPTGAKKENASSNKQENSMNHQNNNFDDDSIPF